jgi:predicted nucleic acid-binding protein
LIAPDTSVVIAAFASWHEGHAAAASALGEGCRLPAHVAIETYSVLTRLPPPHRVGSDVVVAFLERRFGDAWLSLSAVDHRALLSEASELGIAGGALYDAVVAATVREAGATLLTRDQRATRVYSALGVPFRFVS